MASYTLLQLVQTILSSIDGDEVLTISQTVESQQVAVIVETVFNDIFDRAELKKAKQLFTLTSATVAAPTLVTLPTVTNPIIHLDWIQYNKFLVTAPQVTVSFRGTNSTATITVTSVNGLASLPVAPQTPVQTLVYGGLIQGGNILPGAPIILGSQLSGIAGFTGVYNSVGGPANPPNTSYTLTATAPDWEPVEYLPTDQFFALINSYTVSTGDVLTYPYTTPNGQQMLINCKNDIAPTYYTTLDDNTFLFDSFDNSVDPTGLQSSKMISYGEQGSVFSLTDNYVPPLEDHQFSLLLQSSIARAWVELKQQANPKSEQSERRQWVHLQKVRRAIPTRVPAINSLPDYGRRGGWRQDWGADNMLEWMRKGK